MLEEVVAMEMGRREMRRINEVLRRGNIVLQITMQEPWQMECLVIHMEKQQSGEAIRRNLNFPSILLSWCLFG